MKKYNIFDIKGDIYTIAIDETNIYINGKVAMLSMQQKQIEISGGSEKIIVSPVALWEAFFKDDVTPENAGMILADSLARWCTMRSMASKALRIRTLIDEIAEQQYRFIPLPDFDTFTLKLLQTYDGSQSHLDALALLLKQQNSTIRTWLEKIGKIAPTPSTAPTPAPAQEPEQQSEKEKRSVYIWTPKMVIQLKEAFLASPETQPVIDTIQSISERFSWPLEAVKYKVYQLNLPQEKRQRYALLAQAAAHTSQVTPAIPSAPPEAVPLEEQVEVSKPEDTVVVLKPGIFQWEVGIGKRTERWGLDQPYGSIDLRRNTIISYRDQSYILLQVYTSRLIVATMPVPANI